MQKENKTYQAVLSPIVLAMNKTPSEDLKSFIRESKDISEHKYRTYKKPDFPLWRCEGWFRDRCLKYLKMDLAYFQESSISHDSTILSKVGLSKSKSK